MGNWSITWIIYSKSAKVAFLLHIMVDSFACIAGWLKVKSPFDNSTNTYRPPCAIIWFSFQGKFITGGIENSFGQIVIGITEAKQFEAVLVTAAAKMNAVLILIGILLFVSFYAVSIGPVMWVLFSELFPNRIRGLAISFVGLVNLTFAFLVQLVFPWQLTNLGNSLTFFLYAIFAVIGLLFIVAKVPETKGKSLEELEVLLVKSP